MLIHDVVGLILSSPGTTQSLVIDDWPGDLGPDLVLATPVRGQARLHRTQRGIVVQCKLATSVVLECSRCLEPFNLALQIQFSEEFRTNEDPAIELEPDEFRIDEHHTLDLREAARQCFTVELPLAPLCRPECRGLCPNCGALMEGHVCPPELTRPTGPFAALANLLDVGDDPTGGRPGPKSRTMPSR